MGSRVVTASDDNTARVWRADGTGQPIVLRGHNQTVASAAFSSDGSLVVTASWDKTARVWRADGTGQPVVLRDHGFWVSKAVFSLDGSLVVTTELNGPIRVWSLEPQVLARTACTYTGRNFTRDEWSAIFLDTPYRKTCEQWPEAL